MSMRNIRKLIQEEVRKVLKELNTDEPNDDGPFGHTLFSRERIDGVDKTEPDTPFEQEFFQSLKKHITNGSPSSNADLAGIFPKLLQIAKSGKYKNVLQPPRNKKVYRITAMEPGLAAKRLGVSEEELFVSAGPQIKNLSGQEYSSRNPIQSWTPDPNVSNMSGYLTYSDGAVFILFVANTSNNEFLLDPRITKKVKAFKAFESEREVIALNPVAIDTAVFYVQEEPLRVAAQTELRKIIGLGEFGRIKSDDEQEIQAFFDKWNKDPGVINLLNKFGNKFKLHMTGPSIGLRHKGASPTMADKIKQMIDMAKKTS